MKAAKYRELDVAELERQTAGHAGAVVPACVSRSAWARRKA